MKVTDFADQIGITRFDADNWRKRVGLRTEYAPTVAGRAQEYTRDNVLELAAMGALVKAGMTPKDAVPHAHMMVRQSHSSHVRRWMLYPVGDFSQGRGTDNLTPEALEELASASTAFGVICIDLHKLLRTVDGLFAAE